MANAQMLKKITPKALFGNIKKIVDTIAEDGATIPLFRVFGLVDGIRAGESNFGPWEMLTGQFEAINITSGEVFQGTQATIPQPMFGLLKKALQKAGENGSVKFALDVVVKRRDDIACGYEYLGSPLVQAQENDAMSELRAMIESQPLPALAAPVNADNATKTKPKK